ncbi:condensation domain-containing protein, partial [Marinicrinis sediminis]
FGTAYNMPFALRLQGELDRPRLREAFQQLVKRHEAFRTEFVWEGTEGEPVQRVVEDVHLIVTEQQIDEEADLAAAMDAFVQPFDLSHAPLLRVRLIERHEQDHFLLADMPHIISDGTSIAVLVEELSLLYRGEPLPPLRIQYKDYAVWQEQQRASGQDAEQEAYWLKQFAGELPVLNLPTDHPRPAVQSFAGDSFEIGMDAELTNALQALARETGTTLYMVMLAAYQVLLYKYTGQEDMIVGSPAAGRKHADTSRIIGMFVNTLALRSYPEGTKSFRSFLGEVQHNVLQAFDRQDYPYEQLIERLKIKRDLGRNPLFDTMFAMQNMAQSELDLGSL